MLLLYINGSGDDMSITLSVHDGDSRNLWFDLESKYDLSFENNWIIRISIDKMNEIVKIFKIDENGNCQLIMSNKKGYFKLPKQFVCFASVISNYFKGNTITLI